MKRKMFIAASLVALLAGCQKDNPGTTPTTISAGNNNAGGNSQRLTAAQAEWANVSQYSTGENGTANKTTGDGSAFISLDDANTMIASYLYSIDSSSNNLHALTVDADMLRAYLADSTVTNVKLIFGHTMKYIDAGYKGQLAGYQIGALTIILAGYDVKGNYVYHNGMVLDHMQPCPYNCPSGSAGDDLLY